MQSIITLKKILRSVTKVGLSVFLLLAFSVSGINAQTTLTTNHTLNNSNGLVTFNFTNNNATGVVITNIASIVNLASGTADVKVFYKPGAINGPPGAISAANGWTLFGSATITTNGLGTPQSFVNTSLLVPATTTYGIAVEAGPAAGALGYSTITAGPFTFAGGGAVITTGANISYGGAVSPAAPTFTPRGFIGSVTFGSAVPCSGTPAPGATTSTVNSACSGIPFTLSPANATAGTGVTYMWQSSSTGVAGSFVTIPGATSSTYTTSLTASTYYQVIVTCGGNSTTATPKLVTLTPANQCYCIPTASTFGCNSGDLITNVSIGGINNTSACGNGGTVSGYSNYTLPYTLPAPGGPAIPAGTVLQGAANPISVNFPGGFLEFVGVWIDYNQNGIFDATEFTALGSSSAGGPLTGSIVVPASALLGNTRMRVKLNYAAAIAPTSACTGSGFGEIEDYNVTIQPCVPVSITTQPANASAACGSNATFTVATTGSFPTYQWEYMAPNSTTWVLITNAAPFSGANTATLTVAATGSLNGYKFRAIVAGACTGPDFSNSATLTVTPIQLAITPSTVNKCLTGPAVLISAPSTQSVISGTNTTAVPVPDNTAAGATSSIAIAGIPGGASIQRIDVKFNMPHTYVGDMIFNLKAPGGQIINLDKYMGGTGNQAGPYPNTGFVNTIISSAGVTALSSVTTQPVTGTFKADAISGAVPGFPVANPTGYTPTTTSWTTLAPNGTAANGTWILAMADGGPADIGTLTNWTITITYGGAPATVTFTPTAGLFTDAAGTIPYTGGAVTQVYAAPTATSSIYKAVVTSGVCSTDSQTIVVNVNTPAGGTPTLSNTSVCVGSNTFLKLGGNLTGGPGFVHNFQVKAPGAATFTNITAGGVYSFNGDSLKLTGVPLSFNGYQFRDSVSTGGNCGSVISTVATLSVNPIPVVTISAAPRVNLFPGITTTLTAAVSGATPPVTYQWFRNGVAVPGATNNTLVVGIDGIGTYTVRATAQGCSSADSTTTPKTITIGDSVGVTTLFIYPSPNSGKFQVRYFSDINNGAKSPAMVNVFDQKGAKVFSKSYGLGAGYQQMNVDLGTHGRGVYRVELTDLNGDRIKTGSVMVF